VLGWVFPLALVALFGLGTVLTSGFDDFRPVIFIVTLALTAVGVAIGRMLCERFGGATTTTSRAAA
jgi:hypothetical protein